MSLPNFELDFDPDLIFATPLITVKDQELDPEDISRMYERSVITSKFLKGECSATDFCDYIHDHYHGNVGEYLEAVEQNFNTLTDMYGRPIY